MKKILTVTAVLALVCASVFAVGFKAQAGVGLDAYTDDWFGFDDDVDAMVETLSGPVASEVGELAGGKFSKTAVSINLGAEYGFENKVGVFADAAFDLPIKFTSVFGDEKQDVTADYKELFKDAKKYDFKLAIGANYLVAELMDNLDVTVGLGVQGRGQYFAWEGNGGHLNVTVGAVVKASAFYNFSEHLSAGLDLAADAALYRITKIDFGDYYKGTTKGTVKNLNFSAVAAVKYAF